MGNLPTVPLHLPGGAPTTGTASAAFTPSDGFFLIEAARSGNTEVLQLFLNKNKALAWAHSGRDSVTPWHCAAEEGHADALRVLGGFLPRARTEARQMTDTLLPSADSRRQLHGAYACA